MKLRLILFICLFSLSSCASLGRKLKSFMAGGDDPAVAQTDRSMTKFSNNPNLPVNQKSRLYKRVTRDSFEKDGMLQEESGSLWVMEGQGSYLFSQNTVRIVGDLVNVELEGGPRTQLASKVDVIKRLIEKTKRDQKREIAAKEAAMKAQSQTQDKNGAKVEPIQAQNIVVNDPNRADEEKEGGSDGFDVGVVPARIIEKSSDGSYRIKGSQQFMIGSREYKVIVTGMVRSSDIDSDVIQASKVLDPRFDIVSTKKEQR
jgi:flagellar L-ring protein FlgH